MVGAAGVSQVQEVKQASSEAPLSFYSGAELRATGFLQSDGARWVVRLGCLEFVENAFSANGSL